MMIAHFLMGKPLKNLTKNSTRAYKIHMLFLLVSEQLLFYKKENKKEKPNIKPKKPLTTTPKRYTLDNIKNTQTWRHIENDITTIQRNAKRKIRNPPNVRVGNRPWG
jgi:hypothetical protein